MTDEQPAATEPEVERGPNYLNLLDVMSDEDYQAATARVQQMRMANANLLRELTEKGFQPEFTVQMLAVYFEGLVKVGVLSRAQLVTIEKLWEEGFHKQLAGWKDSLDEAIRKAEVQAKLTLPPGQFTPGPGPNRAARRAAGKGGLILPNQ